MPQATPFENLKHRADQVWTLKECYSLASWDQQTLMPAGGAPGRANHLAVLEKTSHQLLSSPDFGQALQAAEQQGGDEFQTCYIRQCRRHHDRACKVPSQLVEELSRTTSHALEVWAKARQTNDFASYQPVLAKMFDLKRQQAESIGYSQHPYDALLDEFEPQMLTSDVERVFSALRPSLSQLVEDLTGQGAGNQFCDGLLRQKFPVQVQEAVARWMLETIGFDFQHGRLDKSVHPFCSTSSSLDVRVTDRYQEDFLSPAVFGALHEGGHGLYEQGSPPELNGTPLRGGCSLGIHESQSRLWENFVGRGLPFWKAHFAKLQAFFPYQLSGYSVSDFYRAINTVQPSLIRVEADEVTYTLHIILRFELEKALLTGDLAVADLPAAWNENMHKYLGIRPSDDRTGCLQDIHWAAGYVGYFPTYSLGNLVAAMMWDRLQVDIPELQAGLSAGHTKPILDWLKDKVHRHASFYDPVELLKKSLDMQLDHQPFMNYLNNKFRPLYGLS